LAAQASINDGFRTMPRCRRPCVAFAGKKGISFTGTRTQDNLGTLAMFENVASTAQGVKNGTKKTACKKIGILIEEHFDPMEFWKFNGFFPAYGYEVEYLSHLWNSKNGLRFGSNPENDRVEFHVTVTKEINDADPADYRGILLIGAYAMDRMRYEEHPKKGQANQSPAVRFLRKAMDEPKLKIGVICHSLWLLCAAPELLKGRKVTCAHNLIADVTNAGGDVQFGDDGTVPLMIDENLVSGKHPAYIDQFLAAFLQEIEKEEA
jgi:protease I